MVPTTRKKAVDVFNQLRGSDEDQLTYGGNFYYVLYEDVQETGWKWNAADGATFVNPAHHAYFVSQSQTTPQDFYPLEQPTSGDVNSDGDVTAADVTELANALVGKPSDNYNSAAADMNANGAVDIQDLTQLIEILLKR
jgi:hypothetical protein